MSQTATKEAAPKKLRKVSGGASVAAMFGEGLGSLHNAPTPKDGAPTKAQEIALELIDEDPDQPRVHFDADALQELADTIAARGVKTPISVRPHPKDEDRYIINHGARRYRASKIAGRTTIPAYLDTDHTADDQVIENLQRDNLSAREIADYLGRELAKGRKKSEIARSIGKSPAYVSQHIVLLDLPDPVAKAMADDKVRDVTLIAELARLARLDEPKLTMFLDGKDEVTRTGIRDLREWIEADHGDGEDEGSRPEQPEGKTKDEAPAPKPRSVRFAGQVKVSHDGRDATLLLDREPSGEGNGFIRYDDGTEADVDLGELEIVAIGGR